MEFEEFKEIVCNNLFISQYFTDEELKRFYTETIESLADLDQPLTESVLMYYCSTRFVDYWCQALGYLDELDLINNRKNSI